MERWLGAVGIAAILAVAWLASTDRRRVQWRAVWVSLGLQFALALLILRTSGGAAFFRAVTRGANAFIAAADAGIEFVFGSWPGKVLGPAGEVVDMPYVFAIRVLPVIVFMSSFFAILHHYGITQRVVDVLARGLRAAMRVSGAESLAAVANVFLGMTEAPLMIRPYVAGLTRSELFCVMTGGLATVAGSVLVAYMGLVGPEYAGHLIAASLMSAPAAIAIAKLMVPEDAEPATLGGARLVSDRDTVNLIDAAAAGATEGVRLALNVGGLLIAFVALIAMANALLQLIGAQVGLPGLTFEGLLGYALAPVAALLGVPWSDATAVGQMLGVKTVINEFVAFQMLADARTSLEPRSVVIASYALCGFANLGSIAILVGGLGGIAPERRSDVARDGLRAVVAGSLATFLTGAIAGLLI